MFIWRGMPGGRQPTVGGSPWPPASWSRRLASKIAWYSALSGAGVGPLLPPVPRHTPERSGYLLSSRACAAGINRNAAAMAAALNAMMRKVMIREDMIRKDMASSPLIEIAQVRRLLALLGGHQVAVGAE